MQVMLLYATMGLDIIGEKLEEWESPSPRQFADAKTAEEPRVRRAARTARTAEAPETGRGHLA